MAVVYKARQAKLERVAAVKMILSGDRASPAELALLRDEARAIARLNHPNIVQIYEVGEHNGRPFLALEFCAGDSLDKKLRGGPLPGRESAALVEVVARAVQAAHEKGVIHRHLKPSNVLLSEDGTPKISDFGLARRLDVIVTPAHRALLGTPPYMAPEQVSASGTSGPLSDVYALGAVLYECLTARPPFRAPTVADTLLQVLRNEIYGIAGESSCGKTTLIKTIAGAVRPPLRLLAGEIVFDFGNPTIAMHSASASELAAIRWRHLSYIMQGSMSVLNPLRRIQTAFVDFAFRHIGRPMPEFLELVRSHHLHYANVGAKLLPCARRSQGRTSPLP